MEGGRLEEEVRQFLTRLVVNNDMSEGLKTGGKETTGRLKGSDVRRGRPGDHGYRVKVIHVNYNQNVLMVEGRGDWEAIHEVGGCPLFAWSGFSKAVPGLGLGTEGESRGGGERRGLARGKARIEEGKDRREEARFFRSMSGRPNAV
jgi:hypothetical protein